MNGVVDLGVVVVFVHVDTGMAFGMSSSVRHDRIRCVCCVKSSSGDGGDGGGGCCAKSSFSHRCDEGACGVNSPLVVVLLVVLVVVSVVVLVLVLVELPAAVLVVVVGLRLL